MVIAAETSGLTMRIITGKHKGKVIIAPHGTGTRPTLSKAREAIFSMLETRAPSLRGCRFLDLYAGSGGMGLEAISRGAARALLVDKAPLAINAARRNIETFKETERMAVLRADASRMPKATETFNIVFMDPPYRQSLIAQTLNHLSKGGWLEDDVLIVAELHAQDQTPAHPLYQVVDDKSYSKTRVIFLTRKE